MPAVAARSDDMERGWAWVVLAAVYAGNIVGPTTYYMNGVIYLALLEVYNMDKAKMALIVSLNGSLPFLLGPFASVCQNRFGLRITLVTGATLMLIGGVCSALASNSADYLILTHGIISGTGCAFGAVPLPVALSFYFDRRRKFFTAVAVAIVGIGMLIATPFCLSLWKHFGLLGTFLIIAGLNAQFLIFGMVCRPSNLEKKLLNERRNSSTTQSSNNFDFSFTSSLASIKRTTFYKLLINIPFILFLFSTASWNALLAIALVHLPNYISIRGSTPVEIGAVMMCFSISNTIGRFLAALTVDKIKFGNLPVHTAFLGVAGIATLTFPFYNTFKHTEYAFAVLTGLAIGGPNSLMTVITLDMAGVEMISSAFGLQSLFCGLGYMAAPPLAAALYAKTKTYRNSFILSGCIVLAGSVLALVASVIFSKRLISASERYRKKSSSNGIGVHSGTKKQEHEIQPLKTLENGNVVTDKLLGTANGVND